MFLTVNEKRVLSKEKLLELEKLRKEIYNLKKHIEDIQISFNIQSGYHDYILFTYYKPYDDLVSEIKKQYEYKIEKLNIQIHELKLTNSKFNNEINKLEGENRIMKDSLWLSFKLKIKNFLKIL